MNLNIPIFPIWPSRLRKNVICKQVAESLGLEFYFTNAVTQEYKLTGFIDANGRYHETQFYKAFVNGGVFMLDEIDASSPEVLVILNAAIANKYFDFPTGRCVPMKISAWLQQETPLVPEPTLNILADSNLTHQVWIDSQSLR